MRLRIATLNILGTADGWTRREPLIRSAIGREQPDILALQEVDFDAAQPDLPPDAWRILRADETRPGFGNALGVRSAVPGAAGTAGERVELGDERCLLTTLLRLPGGGTVRLGSVHLHWQPDEPGVRERQVQRMLDWLAGAPAADAVAIAGDFNATPGEPATEMMRAAGFASAHAAVHGSDPAWTYPSPATPRDIAIRPPSCLDYIWVRGTAEVADAWTAFDEPGNAARDLYPSDHRGLVAVLDIGSAAGR